jgi:hypothetical protein
MLMLLIIFKKGTKRSVLPTSTEGKNQPQTKCLLDRSWNGPDETYVTTTVKCHEDIKPI